MSQAETKRDKINYLYNKPKFKAKRSRSKYFYNDHFQYYNTYNYQPPWKLFPWRRPYRRRSTPEKEPQRSPSPFSGTEEYTLKKIQEASDMIKKQLMMPLVNTSNQEKTTPIVSTPDTTGSSNESKKCENERNAVKNNKKPVQYNVEEIHHKIITHITNLNHGKKMNLICATSSGYDVAIQQIQKQKRLELSKVLRDMCSNQTVDNSDAINSIIPDIGIKIEELPLEVIQELSTTLDMNFEQTFCQNSDTDNVTIKTEVCDSEENATPLPENTIKVELDLVYEDTDCPMDVESSDFSQRDKEIENTECSIMQSQISQTDSIEWNCSSTQTDPEYNFQVNTKVQNLDEAVKAMLEVDNEIARLTKLRQTLFLELQSLNNKNGVKKKKKLKAIRVKNRTTETKKVKNRITETKKVESGSIELEKTTNENFYTAVLNFDKIREKILTMMVTETNGILLAGCESGMIFFINLKDGAILATIVVGPYPITSLGLRRSNKHLHFYVGSFEPRIREYDFDSMALVATSHTGESVQCMEFAWEFIFIGTTKGSLMRHSFKVNKIEFEDKISQDRILVLKATQEGARKVLLVGTKNSPVCIRDAMSGLHMRTMNEIVAPTVYSLLLENSLVYCGTTFHDVLVFSFHDGNLVRKYRAGNSKGIGCMKIVDNLLYTSCHNGNIYVYNIKTKQYVGQIDGPGGVILSMEVYKNIIIIGTMSFHFKSVLIPDYILESNRSAFEL